jgi:hypothetical protein
VARGYRAAVPESFGSGAAAPYRRATTVVTSRKKRKRTAQALGLTTAELQLCDLLQEVLDALRWSQILGWGNQYLLNQRLEVSPAERDKVMRAAAAAVEQDGRLQDWGRRLAEIRRQLAAIDAGVRTGGGDRTPRPEASDAGG